MKTLFLLLRVLCLKSYEEAVELLGILLFIDDQLTLRIADPSSRFLGRETTGLCSGAPFPALSPCGIKPPVGFLAQHTTTSSSAHHSEHQRIAVDHIWFSSRGVISQTTYTVLTKSFTRGKRRMNFTGNISVRWANRTRLLQQAHILLSTAQ